MRGLRPPTRLSETLFPESPDWILLVTVIMVVISVVVAMIVAPGPVLFLLLRREFLKLDMRVSMSFDSPVVVINHFIVVPMVVVGVIRIVHTIGMVLGTSDGCKGRSQCSRQQD